MSYSWDQAAALPQLLQDSAGNTYVYGLDLISKTDSGGSQQYYLCDGLGSTTGLTDGSGSVVATYQYDVYGAIRAQSGGSGNEFTFTGEQNDPTGLEYLRARYYEPATGRFISRDPVPSLKSYAYVANNPCSLVDPSGLTPQEGIFVRCHGHVVMRGIGRAINDVGLCISIVPGTSWGPSKCLKSWDVGDKFDKLVEYDMDVVFRPTASGWRIYATNDSDVHGRLGWGSSGRPAWSYDETAGTATFDWRFRSKYVSGSTFRTHVDFSVNGSTGSVAFGDANPHGGFGLGFGNVLSVDQTGKCTTFRVGGWGRRQWG